MVEWWNGGMMGTGNMSDGTRDYYRCDRDSGITGPDLSKSECTFAEHVVRARGKRTKYTSVSLDRERITCFGPATYLVRRTMLVEDRHGLVEHEELLRSLETSARQGQKHERARSIQALRYVRTRLEGLVDWSFDITGVERKDLIPWAERQVQKYFQRV
jgi:hypothetical protein